ncbi:MAG: hypothetical protein LUH18_02730 [Oscillospiraceae bacterium]|nr:hypothetical protein [Oscillospiraceae bacterium]
MPESTKTEKQRSRKKESRKRYYAKTANLYPRHSWTEEEVKMVMEHSVPDSELSEKIHRSVKSIQQKRLVEKKKSADLTL